MTLRWQVRLSLAVVGVLALLGGCSDRMCCEPPPPPPNSPVGSVTVTPSSASLTVGDTVRLSATLRDPDGQPLSGHTTRWQSSSPTVVTVDASGLVRAAAPGSAEVIASSDDKSDAATITASTVALPPGMSLIAFVSSAYLDAPNGGIKVTAADRSATRTVTISGGDWDPTWSPDGTRLAFESDRAKAVDRGDIFVVNADGSGLVQLTSDDSDDREPAWSPDGRLIAFNRFGIWVMNSTDGSNVRQVTQNGSHPSWSPDGSKIVFTVVGIGTGAGIWVTNLDGSGLTQLTTTALPAMDDTPAWSPDGRHIAFRHTTPAVPGAIYLMNMDGIGVTQLTLSGQRPSWSPDSRMIVYEDAGIYVIGADGSGLSRIGDGFAPAWSRSGSMPPPRPIDRILTIAGGNGQTDSIGATLPVLLSVRVTDAGGTPVPGVVVHWALDPQALTDGASISTNDATTDIGGIAAIAMTLGRAFGTERVVASTTDGTANVPGVVFTATTIRVIHVSVSPGMASLPVNYSQQLIATVTDDTSNAGVIWSLQGPGCSGASCGALSATKSPSGGVVTYTAPAIVPVPATVIATATAVSDSTKSAHAVVTVGPPVVLVSVTPSAAGVNLRSQHLFTASVLDDTTNAGVLWTLSGTGCTGDGCGTLSAQSSQSGVPITYTAPATVPNGVTVTLTATSVADPTKSAMAVVTITSSIQVSITPTGFVGVDVGTTLQLTASVSNDADNRGVTWTLSGAGCSGASCGTISPTGLYTAPLTAPVQPAVTVTAASVTDYTKSASATVVVTVPGVVTVYVSPTSALICTYGCRVTRSRSFTAYVFHDASNAGVSWSAGVGTLSSTTSSSGVAITYTAPSGATGSTVVTATSLADRTKSASATVVFRVVRPPGCRAC